MPQGGCHYQSSHASMDKDIGLHYKRVRIKSINIKLPDFFFLPPKRRLCTLIPVSGESTLLTCIFIITIIVIIIIYVTWDNRGKKHNSPLVGKEYTQHRLAQKYKTCWSLPLCAAVCKLDWSPETKTINQCAPCYSKFVLFRELQSPTIIYPSRCDSPVPLFANVAASQCIYIQYLPLICQL